MQCVLISQGNKHLHLFTINHFLMYWEFHTLPVIQRYSAGPFTQYLPYCAKEEPEVST